ncbi:hypothetical protein Tsubulata_011302, partial [Turnera subulata]
MVQASRNKEPDQKIELTISDVKLLNVGAIQKGLLFLKPQPNQLGKEYWDSTSSVLQHLKTTLSSTLDYFPPLAGRLAAAEQEDKDTVSFFIDCNNEGVQFVHAVADDVTAADILKPIYVPLVVHSFFPLNGALNREGVSKPLVAFQVTELVDGIFIGCALNHAVGDGSTFWNFFNCWSEISRGLDQLTNPPVIERWLYFNDSFRPAGVPLSSFRNVPEKQLRPPTQERVFHFTKKSIAELKARANSEAGTNNISSLQSLPCLAMHKQRLKQPELPEKYFGNAIVTEKVCLKAGDILQKEGLGCAALEMNKVVASHAEDKIKSTLQSWIANPLSKIVDLAMNTLFASSSPRFNVYGNDFGWGRPVAVRSGSANKLDGKITVFPGAEEGSIDVEVCVLPQTLQALGIISSSMVQASKNNEPDQKIELTICDVKFLNLGTIQKGLLFLKPQPNQGKECDETSVHHLKTTLSSTLDYFRPLAGRLAAVEHEDNNTVSFFFDCNNEGALFVHAVADDVTVADILKPIYVPPVISSFFPLNGMLNREGVSKPLIAFQVTELVDGIFIGCTLNHAVGDGNTFWNFFNCWSEISRGMKRLTNPPAIDRWLYFNDSFRPVGIPLSSIKNVPGKYDKKPTKYTLPPIQERVFHFTKKAIAGLKARANLEAGSNSISSLQSLLAHIWRCISRCRQIGPHEEIVLHQLVGLRPRLKRPELPEKYFGNAFVSGKVCLKAGDVLQKNGLGYAALEMSKVVASYTEDKINGTLQSWIANPVSTVDGYVAMNTVFTSSSPRFNVYGNDFGWGRPVAVRSGPANKLDGKITVYPGAEEGSIDVEHLKNTLSSTLDYFPPLAGRLAAAEQEDKDTVSFFIDCNNEGVQFVHAVADDVTVADILKPVYVPLFVHSFFPLNGMLNREGVSKPLVAFQVTELVDGIFIGCTLNHAVGDGNTFWNFFNCWSEFSRGLDHLTNPLLIERWLHFNDSFRPIGIPLSSFRNVPQKKLTPPTQERVFHFTKKSIAELKARANSEGRTGNISSLQSLLPHIWRCITRCRQLEPHEDISFHLIVGIRQRFKQLELPEKYFGNAVVFAKVCLKAGDILQKEGLGCAALEMNKVVASQTENKIKSTLQSSIGNPLSKLEMNFLGASSSPRFNVYGNDFGWGRPTANKLDGKLTVFPGAEEGSIDVEVCVLPQTLQALGLDLEVEKMASSIRIISSSMVQASPHNEPSQKIELTICDVKFLNLGTIQKGLLFLKPKPDQGKEWDETSVHHLKTTLSSTLNHFPPLAGRLAAVEHEDNNTVSFFFDCNNEGILFVHAVADDVTVEDILKPIYVPPVVSSFFPLNGMLNREGVSKPLIAFQVTELVDGIFIGCTMNHAVGDGNTFWNFFNCWSEISRGMDQLTNPPLIERWLYFNDSFRPVGIPLSSFKNVPEKYLPPPIQERVCHFTKKAIAGLKARANSEAGTHNISSLQSVLAHIWRCIIRWRQHEPDRETSFLLHVGIGQRLKQQKLPEKYFGLAIMSAKVSLKEGEILEKNGLGHTALEMNKVIASHTEDKVKSTLQSWLRNPPTPSMNDFAMNALAASSSPRFNVYGNDFGWGRPVAVRSGSANKLDGKITLFPGAEEGSIDVEVCVSPQTLQALGMDPEFMDAVTV